MVGGNLFRAAIFIKFFKTKTGAVDSHYACSTCEIVSPLYHCLISFTDMFTGSKILPVHGT